MNKYLSVLFLAAAVSAERELRAKSTKAPTTPGMSSKSPKSAKVPTMAPTDAPTMGGAASGEAILELIYADFECFPLTQDAAIQNCLDEGSTAVEDVAGATVFCCPSDLFEADAIDDWTSNAATLGADGTCTDEVSVILPDDDTTEYCSPAP